MMRRLMKIVMVLLLAFGTAGAALHAQRGGGGTGTGEKAVPRLCADSRGEAHGIIAGKIELTRYGVEYSDDDMWTDAGNVDNAYNDCVASDYHHFEVTFTWGYTMVRDN